MKRLIVGLLLWQLTRMATITSTSVWRTFKMNSSGNGFALDSSDVRVNGTNSSVNPSIDHREQYETHARNVLNEASKQMQEIYNRKRDIFLSVTKGRGYNVINQGPIKQEIENDYRQLVYQLAANLSRIPAIKLRDPLLRRQVQRLSKLQLYGLEKKDFEEARELLHKMQTFITMRLVCHVQHADDCTQNVAMVPTITNHAIRTKRWDDLQYYWLKWRQALAERDIAKATFIDYVRLLRVAATYNGHITPSRTWYLYFDSENFQRELEDVVWEIMPLYRELHAYLRHSARIVYGNHITESDGGIPAPIMEQIIQQAWFPRTIFKTPFPKHHLPTVQQKLEQVLETPVIINQKAADYFESLGLNKLPESFYDQYSRRINDEEVGPDCKSEVFYFPPEVALRYCPKLDYKKLLQMHGNMAELHYNLYKMDLPFGLDKEPCPGFGSALGEAAVVASGTPRHLNLLSILANYSLSEEQSMNRLFRMGIHTILAINQYFVNEKFLSDMMDGRIEPMEMNCGYWKIQNTYAGVVPPQTRNEKTFDPDYKFYRGLNPEKPNTIKFISEVLGYQFYRAFCLASDQYRPADPEYPLHNCDFYRSEKAGEMMKQMMRSGATKHWRDIMDIAIGEHKLSGRGIMEYFAPLFTWLKQQNKIFKLEAGWDSDPKCISS